MSKGYIFDWQIVKNEIHGHVLLEEDSALIRINDFPFFFYVLLPKNINWTKEKVENIKEELLQYNLSKGIENTQAIFENTKTLYYYQSEKTQPTLSILNDNEQDLRSSWAFFKKGIAGDDEFILPEITELDISIQRKLTAMNELSLCPIIDITKDYKLVKDEKDKVSKLDKEYIVSYENIKKSKGNQEFWKQNPYILSFDLECYKDSKRTGMPDPELPDNYIFFASMIFQRLHDSSTKKTYQLVLGKITDDLYKQTKVNKLIECDTEKLLLQKFFEIIEKEKPQLITGYNTNNWDWNYINIRMKKYKISWSEKIGVYKKIKPKFSDKTWDSNSFGHNTVKYPKIPGIIVFDIFRYYKINKPNLQKHSLGFVSQYFLGRTKLPMSQDRMVLAYEDYSRRNDSTELNEVAYYNLEDSQLVLDLIVEMNIFQEIRNQSVLMQTTIEDLFNKGMQTRGFSEIYQETKKKDYVMNRPSFEGIKIKGGFVLEPKKGIHENVVKLDLASLYPNILKKYNICYSTYINSEVELKKLNEKDYWNLYYEDEDDNKISVKFVKEKILNGVTTELISSHLKERNRIKEELKNKTYGSENEKQTLQDMSYSLKLTTNSIIGLLASNDKFAKLPFPIGNAVITYEGRKLINEIMKFVEINNYGEVLYGDTDSVFLKLKDVKETTNIFARARNVARKINEEFSPFRIEVEDVGMALLLTKKRYSFYPMIEETRQLGPEKSIIYKGTSIARKNTCNFICDSLKRINKTIFEGGNREDLLDLIIDDVTNILTENIKLEDLIFEVKYGDENSVRSYATTYAKRLKDKGKDIQLGDVLEYVVVKDGKTTTIGKRMITPEEYIETETKVSDETKKQIDEFYLLDRLQTCVDEFFDAATLTRDEEAEMNLNIKGLETRDKLCSSQEPMKDIIKMLKSRKKEDKLTVDEIKRIRDQRRKEIKKKLERGEKIPLEVSKLVIE